MANFCQIQHIIMLTKKCEIFAKYHLLFITLLSTNILPIAGFHLSILSPIMTTCILRSWYLVFSLRPIPVCPPFRQLIFLLPKLITIDTHCAAIHSWNLWQLLFNSCGDICNLLYNGVYVYSTHPKHTYGYEVDYHRFLYISGFNLWRDIIRQRRKTHKAVKKQGVIHDLSGVNEREKIT